jgi:hypothetical protein
MLRLLRLATISSVLCLSVASAVAATPPGTYVGRTSDKRHLSFRVSGRLVRSFTFQTRFQCSNHTGFVASATFPSIKLVGTRFNGAFRNKTGSLRTTISGSLHGRTASGVVARRATFNNRRVLDPHGRLVCSSRTKFTAKR